MISAFTTIACISLVVDSFFQFTLCTVATESSLFLSCCVSRSAVSMLRAISHARAKVSASSESNLRWHASLWIPLTKRSRKDSFKLAPKSHFDAHCLRSATYWDTVSWGFCTQRWNRKRSVIINGFGSKWACRILTISLKVLSFGFWGWTRFRTNPYIEAPITLSNVATCFASSTSLAIMNSSTRSIYADQDSFSGLYSSSLPIWAILLHIHITFPRRQFMLYINEANHQPMPSTHFTSVNTYVIHRNTSHDLNTGFHNQEPIRCQTINQVITIHITPNTPQCPNSTRANVIFYNSSVNKKLILCHILNTILCVFAQFCQRKYNLYSHRRTVVRLWATQQCLVSEWIMWTNDSKAHS